MPKITPLLDPALQKEFQPIREETRRRMLEKLGSKVMEKLEGAIRERLESLPSLHGD